MQFKLPAAATFVATAVCASLTAQNASEPPAFDVSSVKRDDSAAESMKFPAPSNGRFVVANVSLKVLIAYAFNVQGADISGDPGWVASDRYDVTAKAAETNLTVDQYRIRVEALLRDRFKLAVHRETKDRNGFMLVAAKGGPKLGEATGQSCVERGAPRDPARPQAVTCGTFFTGPSSLDARKMSMAQFANTLSMVLGNPVRDKTGIAGSFDIHLEFNPEGTNLTGRGAVPLDATPDAENRAKPSLFTALQHQAGLRLEPGKVPVSILVIDHIERAPADN